MRDSAAITRGVVTALAVGAALWTQATLAGGAAPWMNAELSPDRRADLLERNMTLEERIQLLHGLMAVPLGGAPVPKGAIGSAGFIPGVPRLGIPSLQESDASLGIANPRDVRPGEGATALPSGLSLAATFDPAIAYRNGVLLGREARRSGFNVLLGGGVNLARDPRNGRNFEYLGEDPLLAGTLDGEAVRGTQSQHVISTVKHFALNDQETLRRSVSAGISEAAARESDLLAFRIAIDIGHPGAVMCAYNRVNGEYACNNELLLEKILKGDWGYQGWVMSDWGATPGLEAAAHGLDQQSGQQLDRAVYFAAPLERAVKQERASSRRVRQMTHRILRSMFAVGLFDQPPKRPPIDFEADAKIARHAAEAGIVLLKNDDGILPLSKDIEHIAVIGGHADLGVLSGGGSSQVLPPGGTEIRVPSGRSGVVPTWAASVIYQPSPPLAAIRALAPDATTTFYGGAYPAAAARIARRADIAIVFATQWMTEGADAPDLSLPKGQDALIAAVAAANPRTIVVLETGGPVSMPWLDKVDAVVEAWYPGARGGQAIAGVLFGDIDPSGRLPITFPAGVGQLPRPALPGLGSPPGAKIDVDYNIEGADVGYRWYARRGLKPLFAFGYGLSYTRFALSHLAVTGGKTLRATFDVTNTGTRAGSDTPQLYLLRAGDKRLQRLVGFRKVELHPGETRSVTITADRRVIANFDSRAQQWRIAPGRYEVGLAKSAEDIVQRTSVQLDGTRF